MMNWLCSMLGCGCYSRKLDVVIHVYVHGDTVTQDKINSLTTRLRSQTDELDNVVGANVSPHNTEG
jgi:hypothetical protein